MASGASVAEIVLLHVVAPADQDVLVPAALVGVDIIPEARVAAHRDRPETYNAYYVMDLSDPSDKDMQTLSKWNFNALKRLNFSKI